MIEDKLPIEHHQLNWRGITMQVIYNPRVYGGDMPYDHIEVQTDERRQPLPISETGYRSLFLPSGEVENSGGPVVFVKLWLDAKARSKTWRALDMERRQSRLF